MSLIELTENDKRILNAIRNNPNQKRTKISEITKIAWTTTTNAIDKLICAGMVRKVGEQQDIEKKNLEISNNFAYLLGISIGTSHIKVSVLDFSFNIVKKETLFRLLNPQSRFISDFWENNDFEQQDEENRALWCANTPSRGLLNVKKLINDLCEFAIELNQKIKILTIGFSFPGHIDNENGVIIKSSNLDFELNNVGISTLLINDIRKQMEDNDIKVYFEHNVKASAVAEKTIGALKGSNVNSAVMYMGTGLGIAFWLDGKLYRGKSNAAGQLGHIKVNYTDNKIKNKCSCGNTGCLEQEIRDIFSSSISVKKSTGKEIADWLDLNEREKFIMADYLSKVIFNISSLLEIDCIVFSGKLNEIYYSIENSLQERMIQYNQANLLIMTSTLGEYSASIGTALCGYYKLIGYPVD